MTEEQLEERIRQVAAEAMAEGADADEAVRALRAVAHEIRETIATAGEPHDGWAGTGPGRDMP